MVHRVQLTAACQPGAWDTSVGTRSRLVARVEKAAARLSVET